MTLRESPITSGVRFVSVNGEASRVNPANKRMRKKMKTFFFQKIFSEIFPKFFFSQFFSSFPHFFQSFLFSGFTLDVSLFTETKRTLYVSVMKNIIRNKKIGLSSLVMCRVLVFGSYCLDVKSPISSPYCISILFCFSVKHNIKKFY